MAMRIRRSFVLTTVVAAATTMALTGCAAASGGGPPAASVPAAVPVAALRSASVADTKCADGQNQVASIAPGSVTTDPATASGSETLKRIKVARHLTVGTSGDVLLWGASDPRTGQLEGYDIDLLKQIAKYAGVSADKTVYKVINYGQRQTALASNQVDIVAHTMTINCARWQGTTGQANGLPAINFSSEYYIAGQKVLIRADDVSKYKTIADLKNQPVCVPSASTNLANIQRLGLKDIVALDVVGDCLVKFQEGEVAAITGDDTVLAGFAAQDPYAHLMKGNAISEEPYGLGINAGDPQFTQFVNAVLEKLRADGTLQGLYDKWMKKAAGGVAVTIPQPIYGRNIAGLGRKEAT
jgi:polar amino acid transport system substrate-binding protein